MKNIGVRVLLIGILCLKLSIVHAQHGHVQVGKVWSVKHATIWYEQHKWINGCNFIPSTAVNQLEMWQKETFDAATIDKELGYAENIGFNTMRVFLHSQAWKQDPAGFKERINAYLAIANKHHIQTIFVFFDDCWNNTNKIGKQPEPKSGVHNSGWLQDPGTLIIQAEELPILGKYVKDIMKSFAHDHRILLWDLYNEPGNFGHEEHSMVLLSKVFIWARAVNPDQPVTAGLWHWEFEKMNAFQVLNSDIITYHDYNALDVHLRTLQVLKTHGRPLICTEYMARPNKSLFSTIMPMLKSENVGAINWGLVSGKTNTIYAWDKPIPSGAEPEIWFHDIFRKDGTPFSQDEIRLIKKINNKP